MVVVVGAVIALAGRTGSTGRVTVTGFVAAAKQDGPLLIVGFRPPKRVGGAPQIVVRNVSSKQITYFTIQKITGDLSDRLGEVRGLTQGVTDRSLIDGGHRNLAPAAEVTVEEFSSSAFPSLAKLYGTNCINILVAGYRADFSDGTFWQWSPAPEEVARLWQESILPSDLGSCVNPDQVREAVRMLDGSAAVSGLTRESDGGIVSRYSTACTIERQTEGAAHGKVLCVFRK